MGPFQKIPNEIIIAIIRRSPSVSCMAAFAATCRRHYNLTNPILYKVNIDSDFSTAMLWAARQGRIDTLERMLMFGAEVNDTAASLSFVDKVPEWIIGDSQPNKLYHGPIYYTFTPLALAATYGQDTAVCWFLDHQASIEAPAQNLCPCQCQPLGHHNIVRRQIYQTKDSPFWTPLHLAACNGHLSTTSLLISRGADPNDVCGRSLHITTVLHSAALATQSSALLIHYLVTGKISCVDSRNMHGETALHHACTNFQDTSALDKLVELGANLEVHAYVHASLTPLGLAMSIGNFRAALRLLEYGACDVLD